MSATLVYSLYGIEGPYGLYIGITKCKPSVRWLGHLNSAKLNRPSTISRAIRKHGAENFTFWVIQQVSSREEVLLLEQYWIEQLRASDVRLYNETSGGEHYIHSNNTKSKMSKAQRHRRLKVPVTEEFRQLMSSIRKTHKPLSEQARKNLSEAQKRRFSDPVERKRMRALTLEGRMKAKNHASG